MDQLTSIKNDVMTLTGGQGIVESLKREGVEKVFTVPGESFLPVLDALYGVDSIELISTRHEGGAAFMAEGYAKASGKPGVVMATRGVGASNLSIGVHTAYQDSTPMVVLLGQVHSKVRGREGFQEVDLDQFFKHIAKWTFEIKDSERVPEIMQRAFRIAQSGRPGPVVISLPEDMLKNKSEMTFGPPFHKSRPRPGEFELQAIKNCLQEAKRPLIIAGGGVKLAHAEKALQDFAEKNDIPVMCAFRRHDVFPHSNKQFCGHLGLGTNPNVKQTVKEADVILAIGTRFSEVTTQDYSIIDSEQKLIHIDVEADEIGKIYSPHIGVQADAHEALHALNELDLHSSWSAWAEERRQVYEGIVSKPVENHDPINRHIIALMEKHLPKDAIITNDAGNFAGWLHAFYPFNERNTYVGPTSGAMGYGLPAAIGAKLAEPHRTVVSLSGDGGFMMTVQELETAARYGIPTISIVFNNQMYGTIRMHQEVHFPNRVIGTGLGDVRFADLAKTLGANGFFVNDIQSFEYALLEALKSERPAVIEVMTNPEQISVSATIEDLRNR
ncbi:thiamine pyrophosphate-dependent enzyme [Bacillaceae bacterium W0354]